MLGRARRPEPKPTSKGGVAKSVAAKRPFTFQSLWRQAGWGLAAVVALFIAILSTRDDEALQKVSSLVVSFNFLPASPPKHQFDAEAAARQLAQALRGLADDRDRLAIRLAALERDMDDTTGSIKKQIEAVKTAKSAPPPWPDQVAPVPMTSADIAAMIKPAAPSPAAVAANSTPRNQPAAAAEPSPQTPPPASAANPSPATAFASAATPYGADIGTALTMKALHTRWTWLRTAHPALFEGLQPLVSLKQNPRSNRTELHLIVGPYGNAEAAEQFCDFVVPFRLTCEPAMFDGSRLTLQ
jgi:hypothetical protein